MSKVLPFILALLVVAVLSFTLLSPKQNPASSQSYLEFLPSDTTMLLTSNSPAESAKKVDFKKYAELFETAGAMMPFDFTNPQFYQEKGINLASPAGFAICSLERQTMFFFCGVQDEKAFAAFLQENILVGRDIQPAQSGNLPCFLIKDRFGPSFDSVYLFKDGYFLFYATGNLQIKKNLVENLEKEILDTQNRLSQNPIFQEASRGIQDQGDLFLYMDYPGIIKFSTEKAKRFQPGKNDMMDNLEKIAEDFTSLAISLKLAGSEFQMHTYMGFKGDSQLLQAYKGKGTAEDLLQRLPANPLVCAANSSDMQKSWEMAKPTLDMVLSTFFISQKVENLDALFAKIENTLSQELGITVSLEKDLIQNIQGTNTLVLYNLPSLQSKEFDLLVGIKLNDASKINNLLKDVFQAIQKKSPDLPIASIQEEGCEGLVFDLKKMQPDLSLSPALCIWKDYLILVSQKSMLKALNQEKGEFFDSIQNPKIVEGLKKGLPTIGYIRLGKLVEEILALSPPQVQMQSAMIVNFTKNFQELIWTGEIVEKGMKGLLVLKSSGDFLGQIFDEMSKIMQQMNQQPK
ncbi:MAG: hypothetical protein HUU50_00590 [Candidatus Brocadiae bacterium]|nr:hypothetical protein [Candidatus Brocadiia bacterium]